MLRVVVGDLVAEGSRQARLQVADLVLRFAGLMLGGSISTLSDAALSAVWPLSPAMTARVSAATRAPVRRGCDRAGWPRLGSGSTAALKGEQGWVAAGARAEVTAALSL